MSQMVSQWESEVVASIHPRTSSGGTATATPGWGMGDMQWDGSSWVRVAAASVSVDSIRQLDWRQFVHLVAEGYRRARHEVIVTGDRSDDGVDLVVSRAGGRWFVQCKHWRAYRVDRAVVRALYGRVAAHGATGGVLLTCGVVDAETQEFADRVGVQLVGASAINDLIVDGKLPAAPGRRARSVKATPVNDPSVGYAPARVASYASQHEACSSHLRERSRPRRRGLVVGAILLPPALAIGGSALLAQSTQLAAPARAPSPSAALGAPSLVNVGERPVAIAIDAEARIAYTANFDSSDVSVIDLDTLMETERIDVPGRPAGIVVDAAHRVLFVADHGGATVYGISTDSGKQVTRFKTAKKPDHLALDSARRRLYVSSANSDDIQVFDTKAKKKLRPLEASGPSALAMDEEALTLHVAKRGSGCILARDIERKAWAQTCIGTAEFTGIAVDEQRQHLYSVTGERWIRDFDLTAATSVKRPIPSVADAIAVDPSTHTAYVVDTQSSTVAAIALG